MRACIAGPVGARICVRARTCRPVVAEWSGMDDLELTSFFGVREYYPGAVLAPHTDREDTHGDARW